MVLVGFGCVLTIQQELFYHTVDQYRDVSVCVRVCVRARVCVCLLIYVCIGGAPLLSRNLSCAVERNKVRN